MALGIVDWSSNMEKGRYHLAHGNHSKVDSPRCVDDIVIEIDIAGTFDTVETMLVSNKRVQFAEPLVTRQWETPRVEPEMKNELFYSVLEIANFRKQHKTRYGDEKQHDRVYCEDLVEQLDAMGSESFAQGDLRTALRAFHHSLRVKTETMVDFNHFSTANTIHCIADVYSKQRKWPHALDAYESALEALSCEKGLAHDAGTIQVVDLLQRKILIIRQHLQFNLMSCWTPSTVVL